MSDYNIAGIQQVGIGVSDAEKAWRWYAKHFGMDLPIFNDEAEASLMAQYTGGKVHRRKAILAMNLEGGGGFEIWQYTSRSPEAPRLKVKEGDLGISHIHLRTHSVKQAWEYFNKVLDVELSVIKNNDIGNSFFELIDPFGNQFKIIQNDYRFIKTKSLIGGVIGATIGVSNTDESLKLYSDGLKYNKILSRKRNSNDLDRTWIAPTKVEASAFGNWLGLTQLELVCDPEQDRKQIFKDRYWGDLGFIHICFDVQGMSYLREKCTEIDHAFTVDSENSFDMGEAAGQFAYVEDNDRTLIELVETHKVPILKKMGLYINLKNKKRQKPLPKLIFKILAMNRLKQD